MPKAPTKTKKEKYKEKYNERVGVLIKESKEGKLTQDDYDALHKQLVQEVYGEEQEEEK